MLEAKDVSYYIVGLSDHLIEDGVSNLKLQKILYYAQGHHLALYGEKLFHDDIYAWTLGPVVPDVYHTFKPYNSNPIIIPFEKDNFEHIPKEKKLFLSKIYTYYRQFSAVKLVAMTHCEEPWITAYKSPVKIIDTTKLMNQFRIHTIDFDLTQQNAAEERKKAALLLLPDYESDTELLAFSVLDGDDLLEYEG